MYLSHIQDGTDYPSVWEKVDYYILYDTDFEAEFKVLADHVYENHYLSSVYYEIAWIYESKKLNVAENMKRLFMSEYLYSLEKRGVDIRETGFFKHCGIDVDKLAILL